MFTREGNSRQKLKPRQTGILKFCCLWEHVARRNRRKNSHLCLNDGSVDFWCSEATFRGPRQSVWAQQLHQRSPLLQFTAHSCLFTELTTRQTLVLMDGRVKRDTSLTLLTVLVLLPILSSCKMLQKIQAQEPHLQFYSVVTLDETL